MFLRTGRIIVMPVLFVVSLSFGFYSLFQLSRPGALPQPEKNEVVIWENRFEAVGKALPAGTQRVGYLAEWDFPDKQLPPGFVRKGYMTEWDLPPQYRQIDQLNEFRLTKYAMAPVIVERGSDDAWIIGNFSTRKFEGWLQATIGDYQAKDMGGGIYLIHKVQP